jgi:hypothetical protein
MCVCVNLKNQTNNRTIRGLLQSAISFLFVSERCRVSEATLLSQAAIHNKCLFNNAIITQ